MMVGFRLSFLDFFVQIISRFPHKNMQKYQYCDEEKNTKVDTKTNLEKMICLPIEFIVRLLIDEKALKEGEEAA